MNIAQLKALALAAPTVVFDNETESGRFYAAANPTAILELIEKLEILTEALEADVRIIGGFLDRLTPEAIAQPELSTAHLGMLEAMHCYKRARAALGKAKE